MFNFQKLCLLLTSMLLLWKPVIGKSHFTHKSCGQVDIQFPFYVKNSKLNDTNDYPRGFDLSCTQKNETILELPTVPINFFIRNIDYISQQIEIYDPQNCLSSLLLKLGNASVSPFQFSLPLPYFYYSYETYNVSFFRCDSKPSCPILVVQSNYDIGWYETLLSCTKVKDILSVYPYDIFYQMDVLVMKWSKPDCGDCEARGQKCGWKNGSNSETECFVVTSPTASTMIHTSTIVFIVAGAIFGLMYLLLLILALVRKYRSNKMKGEDQVRIEKFLEDYRAMKPARFSYADIKRITSDFKQSLGEGAHGEVFKGMLSQEIPVAVKILNDTMDTMRDGKDFINEVGTIGKIHHVNVVRLLGFCAEGFHRALVYDFFPNGSLQRFLAPPDNKDAFLGWEKLQQIALGVAKGIEYLHLGCDQRILHFDINPRNILVDDQFVPKITDFGLAKLCPKNQSVVSMTAARGTLGYIAPEVFSRNFGNVSYKADIYSYGMLLLEMVGGRKNTNVSEPESFQVLYPEWIHDLLQGRDVQISVEEEGDVKIAKELAIIGLWCIRWNPVDRPSMKTVVQMLEGDGDELIAPPAPFDITGSSTTNAIIPPKRQTFELEVIEEIDE